MVSSKNGVFKMPTYSCIDGLFMPIQKGSKRQRFCLKRKFVDFGYILDGEQCDAFDQTVLFSLISQAEAFFIKEKEVMMTKDNKELTCLYEKMGGRDSVYYKTTMYRIAKDCFGKIRPNTEKYERLHNSLDRLSSINVKVNQKVGNKIIKGSYTLLSYTSIEDTGTGKVDVYVSFSEFFSRLLAGYIKQFTLIDFEERAQLSSFAKLIYSYLCFVVRPKGNIKNWSVDTIVEHVYNIDDVSTIDSKILYKYRKNVVNGLKEINEKTSWTVKIEGRIFTLFRPAAAAAVAGQEEE